MKISRLTHLLLWLALAIAGCSKKSPNSEVSQTPALQPTSAHGGAVPASASGPGLKYTSPAGWIAETPSSASRKAQYKLPRVEGDPEDAELVIYYFGGGGGAIQANVDRWIGEFSGPDGKPVSNSAKVVHKTLNGIPLTLVDVTGTYSSSMGTMMQGQRAKSGIRLLGAIAEAPNGPWFIKLTGPVRTIAKWESSFQSFLNSFQPGE